MKITKKILFFAAVMGVAFTSCMNEEFIGDNSHTTSQETPGAISFAFDVPQATRADGAAAATKLNNQFIVWGEKNETTAAPATGNLVFPDYKVTYGANTAYTTTSNTKDWEYVGLSWTSAEAANITEATTAVTTNVQTIKYWDYAATSYTFTAVSAKPADISDGKVKINKVTTGTSVYDKGYTVTVTDEADLTSLYFADRVNIAQSNDKDRTESNKYGGNIKFTFRNGVSQVRVGMYETIPGYEVKVTKFYYADAEAPAFTAMTTENTTNFVANVPNVAPASGKTSVPGTFTVKYYPKNAANDAANITNHPTISFTADPATGKKNYLSLGTGVYNTTLATTSATPTFDQTAGAFTTVFPQEGNETNLKLKIDYQLKNTVTGETINITGKTAEVPAKYLAWKPNFKYTYLFKITDDDLYPITFDAVTIEAEDGNVEYITTVSEPSITTFGVKSNKYQVGNDQYEAGSDVYATIVDGSVIDPTGKYNVYTVTTTDATNFPITEGSVAESIAEISAKNPEVKCAAYTGTKSLETTVPGEDGKTITLSAGKAIKLPALAAGTYAVEYEKTARSYKYVEVSIADAAAFTTAKTALNLYEDNTGTTAVGDSDTYDSDKHYYKKVVDDAGVYAYKVIVVK